MIDILPHEKCAPCHSSIRVRYTYIGMHRYIYSYTYIYISLYIGIKSDCENRFLIDIANGDVHAYVNVLFSSDKPLKTQTVTTKESDTTNKVIFQQVGTKRLRHIYIYIFVSFKELWFPVLVPTMTNRIAISVWDWRHRGHTDELIGHCAPFDFSQIQDAPPAYVS
jgi:hypothetical protein